MMCAGDLKKGKIDACQGDSGGPVAWLDDQTGEVKVVGVTSYGYRCALAGSPGVYARVTEVLDWINEVSGYCNQLTCREGNCMTKDKLSKNALDRFNKVTEHRDIPI